MELILNSLFFLLFYLPLSARNIGEELFFGAFFILVSFYVRGSCLFGVTRTLVAFFIEGIFFVSLDSRATS